ncbi:MAG TPA: hypothetical protein VF928_04735 [Usitatibacteraceae bacterium]
MTIAFWCRAGPNIAIHRARLGQDRLKQHSHGNRTIKRAPQRPFTE